MRYAGQGAEEHQIGESGLTGPQGPPGTSGGGLTDLGSFSIEALFTEGPQALITPSPDTFCQVMLKSSAFVAASAGGAGLVIGVPSFIEPFPNQVSSHRIMVEWGDIMDATEFNEYEAFYMGWIADGQPVKAYLISGDNGFPILSAPQPYQLNHSYPTYAMVTANGSYWSYEEPAGATGDTPPDWTQAPNQGDHILDPNGQITWDNEGPIPVGGSFHAFALA